MKCVNDRHLAKVQKQRHQPPLFLALSIKNIWYHEVSHSREVEHFKISTQCDHKGLYIDDVTFLGVNQNVTKK